MDNTQAVPVLPAEYAGLSRQTLIAIFAAMNGIVVDSKFDDTEIKNTLANHALLIAENENLAKKLDTFEKGQIEEMLAVALNNASLSDVLSGFAINVRGTDYSIKSVVEAWVNAPQIAENEFTYDATTKEVTAIKITSTAGNVATLNRIVAVDDATGVKTHTFAGSLNGIDVERVSTWKNEPIQTGATQADYWMPLSESNLIFDMTSQLATPVVPNVDSIADINSDGNVGNPTA